MSVAAGQCEVRRFRTVIARRLGLQFEDDRFGLLGAALQHRLAQLDMPARRYLCALAAGTLPSEPAALAEALTVGETYFFRNSEQFRALVDVAVPARMRAVHGRRLSVLSAGCASGEEAYSLAIALRETLPDADSQAEIRAVDLSPTALAKAARARYSPWALRETPADIQRRWFRAAGREMALAEDIRAGVRFENRNMADDDQSLWQSRSFDIVFCRNVIMYFTAVQARALLVRLARSLLPGGYLFLGHAETLRGLSDDFILLQSHGTFYYQRKDDAPTPPLPYSARPEAFAPTSAASDLPNPGGDWMERIRDAGKRVAALQSAMPAARRPAAPSTLHGDLAAAVDLLRRERFPEALASVAGLPPAAANDPDVLLLTATILAHGGQSAAAEKTCRRLLATAGGNAGAHYVLALCREAAGDAACAAEHDRTAIYLDGSFAMPRLHLGLLTRRFGDREAARRELGQALVLLRREDPSRLLMFGGGFGRAGLISLCAAALRDCRGGR
ncbi:MAG TPA: CheR family methyltransferase [Stellaceae bacterium]|nr:CheR family methyltransferase [Stellaceae bacterium]